VPAEHPKHGEVPEGMRVTNSLDREDQAWFKSSVVLGALLNFLVSVRRADDEGRARPARLAFPSPN